MSRRHALSFHLTPVPQGSAVTFIHSVKSDLQRRVGLLASARLVVSSNEMGRSVNGRSALCRSCANRTDFNLENEIYPVHQPGSFGSAPTTIQLRSASLALLDPLASLDRCRLLIARVGSLLYVMMRRHDSGQNEARKNGRFSRRPLFIFNPVDV